LQQQQQQQQQRIGHEKSNQLNTNITSEKEDERIIPHQQSSSTRPSTSSSQLTTQNPQRGLSTRPANSHLGLFNLPSVALPSMKLDVVEEKNRYLIHADVPGFTKDQINLQIHDGVLTLKGENSSSKEESDPDRKYHRVERSSGSVFRSMRLPEGIKEDEVTATCENGVLNVILPKLENVEKKKERKIRVE